MGELLDRRGFFSKSAKGLAALVIGRGLGCGNSSSTSKKITQSYGSIQLDHIDKKLDDFIINYPTSRIIIGDSATSPTSQARHGAFLIKIDLENEVKRRYGPNAAFSPDVIKEAKNISDHFSTNFIAIGSEADNVVVRELRNSGALSNLSLGDRIPQPTWGIVEGYNVGGLVITGESETEIFVGCSAIAEFNRYDLHAKKIHFRYSNSNNSGLLSEFIIIRD